MKNSKYISSEIFYSINKEIICVKECSFFFSRFFSQCDKNPQLFHRHKIICPCLFATLFICHIYLQNFLKKSGFNICLKPSPPSPFKKTHSFCFFHTLFNLTKTLSCNVLFTMTPVRLINSRLKSFSLL